MDAFAFLKHNSPDRITAVAAEAGTTFEYFKQIAYGHRRPSVLLAKRLVETSHGELDFEDLLLSPERREQRLAEAPAREG